MMKKQTLLTFLCGLAAMICACNVAAQNQPFLVKGKMSQLKDGTPVTLRYITPTGLKRDTAIVKQGNFVIKGEIEIPNKAMIYSNDGYDQKEFMLDYGTTSIAGKDSFHLATLKGGKSQGEFKSLQDELKPLFKLGFEQQTEAEQYKESKNEAEAKKVRDRVKETFRKIEQTQNRFIQANPDSYVSLSLLLDKSYHIIPAEFEPLFNALNPTLKNSTVGKKIEPRLAAAKKTDIGQPAPDFTQHDTTGKPVSLSSLKGKYVFIDFWASWCGPCRAENPTVKKAYAQYAGKNFEIIAVSLDNKKADWCKAIQEDGLPWLHVSDLKGWQNEVARAYQINAVPNNLLLDPEGKILAKSLYGEELLEKLKEVLGK